MAKRLASQQMTNFPAESRASGLQDTFRQLQLGTRLLARHEPISTLNSAVHLAVQRPSNTAAPSQTPRDVAVGLAASSSARAVTTTGTGGAEAAAEAEAAAVAEAEPEVKTDFLLPLVPGAAAAARGATLRPTPPTSPAPVRRSIGFESTEPTPISRTASGRRSLESSTAGEGDGVAAT